jgi:hypothetical protein
MLIDEGRIKLADKLLIPNDLGQAQLGGSLQVHCSRGQAPAPFAWEASNKDRISRHQIWWRPFAWSDDQISILFEGWNLFWRKADSSHIQVVRAKTCRG